MFVEAITEIAKHSGRKDKEQLLKEFDDQSFREFLHAVYNPMFMYGYVNTVPMPETLGAFTLYEVWGEAKALLNSLQTRELSGTNADVAVSNFMAELKRKDQLLFGAALVKDLGAGIGVSTINKVFKNLIPETPYMRCSLPKAVKLDEFGWDNGCYSQEKADGMFVNLVHYENGDIELMTRPGHLLPLNSYPYIWQEARERLNSSSCTQGELLVKKNGFIMPREEGNGVLNHVNNGGAFEENEEPYLMVWDQVDLDVWTPSGKGLLPYSERYLDLSTQLAMSSGLSRMADRITMIDTRVVHSLKEAYEHCRELLMKGKEGTIVKKRTAPWIDGTSKDQIKLKLDFDVELKVVGFTPGKGKHKDTFGSIMCVSEDLLLAVNVSGFSDKKRKEINDDADGWLDKVITVRANGIMHASEGKMASLFLPRFVEERFDKTIADTLPRICELYEAALEAAYNV